MPETKEKQTKEKQTQTMLTTYNTSTTTVVQERHLDGGVLFGLQFYHRGAKHFLPTHGQGQERPDIAQLYQIFPFF